MTAANPYIRDPGRIVDEELVLRRYRCPDCCVILDTEIARACDPILWDIALD